MGMRVKTVNPMSHGARKKGCCAARANVGACAVQHYLGCSLDCLT
jgi:hypothetical protein